MKRSPSDRPETELRVRLPSAMVAELLKRARANHRERDVLVADALRLYLDVGAMVDSFQNLQAVITNEHEEIRSWLRTIADFIVDAERASAAKRRPGTP